MYIYAYIYIYVRTPAHSSTIPTTSRFMPGASHTLWPLSSSTLAAHSAHDVINTCVASHPNNPRAISAWALWCCDCDSAVC